MRISSQSLICLWSLLVTVLASDQATKDEEERRLWNPVKACPSNIASPSWCPDETHDTIQKDPKCCKPNGMRILSVNNDSVTWSPAGCKGVVYRLNVKMYYRARHNANNGARTTDAQRFCFETTRTTVLFRDLFSLHPADVIELDPLTISARVPNCKQRSSCLAVCLDELRNIEWIKYYRGSSETYQYNSTERAAIFDEVTQFEEFRTSAIKEIYEKLQNWNSSEVNSTNIDNIVNIVNTAADKTWTAVINPTEFKAEILTKLPGFVKMKDLMRNMSGMLPGVAPGAGQSAAQQNFDDNFDAGTKWTGCGSILKPSINQAGCGSCPVVAAISVFTDRYCIANRGQGGTRNPIFSPSNAVACSSHLATGGDVPSISCFVGRLPMAVYEYVVNHGVVTEACQPYPLQPNCGSPCSPTEYIINHVPTCSEECVNETSGTLYKGVEAYAITRIQGCNQTNATEAEICRNANYQIMREISTRGPVSACFIVYEDFHHYSSGVYQHVDGAGTWLYMHCVRLVGWGVTSDGVKFWRAANSWGENWGEGGFFRILRGHNHCGIEGEVDAIRVV